MNCTGVRECSLRSFSYTPGTTLNFDAVDSVEYGEYGSGWTRYGYAYRATDSFSFVEESDRSQPRSADYLFTADTEFAISPVPEPHTYLMLGAGLALLGAAKRRRSNKG